MEVIILTALSCFFFTWSLNLAVNSIFLACKGNIRIMEALASGAAHSARIVKSLESKIYARHVMSRQVMSCLFMSRHVTSLTSRHVTSHHITSRHVTSYQTISHHVTTRHKTSRNFKAVFHLTFFVARR